MPGLLFDTLDRLNNGPRVQESNFDKSIFPRMKELIRKYEIKYNPEFPVPDDDAMVDRLFSAGLEYAIEKGLWVLDTQKVIKFSQSEIWRVLDNIRSPLWFGHAKDQVCLMPRKPESTVRPLVLGGAAGSSVSEGEIYTKLMMGYALEPTIDMISNANPTSIEGREISPYSPLETHGAIQEVAWIREAVRRAGRPGMPLWVAPGSAATAPPAIAVINEERGIRKGDFLYAAMLTELKVDFDRLTRAVAAIENEIHVATLLAPMIGGWAGPAEGAAIIGVAACILASVAFSATIVINHPVIMTLKNGATTHRQTLWVESVVGQAMSRNTIFPIGQNVFVDARAGTHEILYETAANAIVAVSSGQHTGAGPSGVTGGEDVDMISPMEARMMGEVSRAVTGMSRKEANRIVKYCLEKYEPTLGNPPKGERYQDLYDLKKLQPHDHWLEKFEMVKEDLKQNGVPFRY
jgi:methylamine---corrinoid protein Co-methyltransferase